MNNLVKFANLPISYFEAPQKKKVFMKNESNQQRKEHS